MQLVEWSDEAQLDLVEIQYYIEQYSPTAAQKLRNLIEECAERLPLLPFAFRSGRVPGTREYVVHPNYIMIYRVGKTIEILRILHSRQQYP
ncbi:MAG: type II toxin-antitoxin system RelE/ParE family toxin [Alcaligenaceae bacterium]|nr:type II toxin-antitoxin system RelE/ParE family toxin [Alcaligenaceae bacterium]